MDAVSWSLKRIKGANKKVSGILMGLAWTAKDRGIRRYETTQPRLKRKDHTLHECQTAQKSHILQYLHYWLYQWISFQNGVTHLWCWRKYNTCNLLF